MASCGDAFLRSCVQNATRPPSFPQCQTFLCFLLFASPEPRRRVLLSSVLSYTSSFSIKRMGRQGRSPALILPRSYATLSLTPYEERYTSNILPKSESCVRLREHVYCGIHPADS